CAAVIPVSNPFVPRSVKATIPATGRTSRVAGARAFGSLAYGHGEPICAGTDRRPSGGRDRPGPVATDRRVDPRLRRFGPVPLRPVPPGPRWPRRAPRRVRPRGRGGGTTAAGGLDLPHLLDDQAGHVGGADDALRAGQGVARG